METSAEERRRWRERMASLAAFEESDEPEPEARDEAVAAANTWRAEHGLALLEPWWAEKTEHRLHERARALGLLRPVR